MMRRSRSSLMNCRAGSSSIRQAVAECVGSVLSVGCSGVQLYSRIVAKCSYYPRQVGDAFVISTGSTWEVVFWREEVDVEWDDGREIDQRKRRHHVTDQPGVQSQFNLNSISK
eukprot:2290286-Rhodomonas_salina.2